MKKIICLIFTAFALSACYSDEGINGDPGKMVEGDFIRQDIPNLPHTCDGCRDDDGDGYLAEPFGPDCADNDPLINPSASEICDGIDNDCDALTDNLAEIVIQDSLYHIIEADACATGCCSGDAIEHHAPGLVSAFDLTALDFAQYSPYGIAVRVSTEHLYASDTAETDARIDYHIWYDGLDVPTVSPAGSGSFRSPQADIACGDLGSAPFEPRLREFTSTPSLDIYPTSVEIWVPECGDDRLILRQILIQIFMTCSSEQEFPAIPGEEE